MNDYYEDLQLDALIQVWGRTQMFMLITEIV